MGSLQGDKDIAEVDTAGQLIRLHLRIGECLERLHGKDLKYAAELALHFEKGWDWSRAVCYLTQAAANAARRFANREAYDYLVRALGMVERLPQEKQAETRIDLLKQSSAIRRSMGEMAGAKADLENMLATARASGNRRAEVLALLELSRVLVWLDRRQCLELVEQAMECSKDLDDKILQSVVKGMWGGLNLVFRPWRADFARACDEAMDVARASASPLVLHSRLTQQIYNELLASRLQKSLCNGRRGPGVIAYAGRWLYIHGRRITTADWLCCIWANGESCGRDCGGKQACV